MNSAPYPPRLFKQCFYEVTECIPVQDYCIWTDFFHDAKRIYREKGFTGLESTLVHWRQENQSIVFWNALFTHCDNWRDVFNDLDAVIAIVRGYRTRHEKSLE